MQFVTFHGGYGRQMSEHDEDRRDINVRSYSLFWYNVQKCERFRQRPKGAELRSCSCGCNRLVNNASRVVADYPRSPTVFWCATDICVVRIRAGLLQ